MQNTELEALRRLLFFSPPEAAMLVGGVSEQAWRRWEAGARKVPDDVARRILDLARWRAASIEASARQIVEAPTDAQLALVWYDRLDDWATLPNREPAFWRPQQSVCASLLEKFHGRLRLVRFNALDYAVWLNGRQDSESMRGAWAATVMPATQHCQVSSR